MIIIKTAISDMFFESLHSVQVDDFLFREAMTQLDIPSPHADHLQRAFCSPEVQIRMVMNDRNVLAKKISEAMTQQILDYMSKQDTVMGYKVVHAGGTQKVEKEVK